MRRTSVIILAALTAMALAAPAADERILREKFFSNGAMNGTNSTAQLSASWALGATLYEVGMYSSSSNSVTGTVQRISGDLRLTNTITTVVCTGADGLTTLYAVECAKSFQANDILRITPTVTGTTFSAYGLFGVKEP